MDRAAALLALEPILEEREGLAAWGQLTLKQQDRWLDAIVEAGPAWEEATLYRCANKIAAGVRKPRKHLIRQTFSAIFWTLLDMDRHQSNGPTPY